MFLLNKTILRIMIPIPKNARFYLHVQTKQSVLKECPPYFSLCKHFENNEGMAEELVSSMVVHNDFLNIEDEQSIMDEIDPYMKKLRYEFDHWDDAIHGYRETERLKWNDKNDKTLDRVRGLAFPPNVSPLKFVHILDLDKNGYIKPHIDAVRFCGDTIAGLSLLTDSIMRLVHDKQKQLYADILLKRRSLYIMKGTARFDYTHEILSNDHSVFKGEKIFKDRRISVICRNEPDTKHKDA
ncbi:unnamed protein product [Acanthoscelides obtectus]|uniref:Alpha-ketoglutarate-dependent dioxygenase AlkB-like domain-containing protein n=1 Tax=Acanthoscelides obtectus TaxID=200917 RepID=A0A9P0PNK9_ACAOB|nr:unnamed protein product [Acanthoscelides obtectus]CAK1662710.1 Alpha-ketoglutarate-dependent dioxygenase alkB homolog 7, mitochondrial [Acanthoscelides obtectus]